MNKEFKIDYLQFSSPYMPRWLVDSEEEWRKPSGGRFYKTETRFVGGAMMYEGNPNSDKKLFVMSGKTCNQYGVSERAWIEKLVQDSNNTVSRIDLCCTVDISILDKAMSDSNKVVSKKYGELKVIADKDYTPQTIYFGDMKKRGRNGIVRMYDKALELGLDMTLHRIELELKRDDAQLAAKRYASGETIPAIMNSKFYLDTEWYKSIFGDDISTKRFPVDNGQDISEIERKMIWLETQVMPSMQYVLDYDKKHGTENLQRLLSMLQW